MNITRLALERPITTLMIFLSVVVLGLASSQLLKKDYFPEIQFPGIFVQIPYSGSTAEEIEKNITRPIEEALATISGIDRLQSTSTEEFAQIRVLFDWSQDAKIKGVEAREKIDAIAEELPNDIRDIFVFTGSTNDEPILELRISSTEINLSNAYRLLEKKLQRPLERIAGVSQVDLYGVNQEEIIIELNPDRLFTHQIDLIKLSEQLSAMNNLLSGGWIKQQGQRISMVLNHQFASLEEIENIRIHDTHLRIKDIARVRYVTPPLDHGRHLGQQFAIGLSVQREANANIVEVTAAVEKKLDAIQKQPDFQGIQIYTMDNQADGITKSLNDISLSGFIGFLLSIGVLYLFLQHFTSTLIVALAVPFALLITLAAMYLFNISLNILSMMGLMLAVGMLVDNAVVISESIYHRRAHTQEPTQVAVVNGVKMVSTAVIAGTLTTAIVFLPNIIGEKIDITIFLSHVAITICIALLASLFIALTIIPLLLSKLPSPKMMPKARWMEQLTKIYEKWLNWVLTHPKWSSFFTFLILFSIVVPASLVHSEMFPADSQRRLQLNYHLTGAFTVERIEEEVSRFESYLYDNAEDFDIDEVYSFFNTSRAESTLLLKKGEAANFDLQTIKERIEKNLPESTIMEPSFEREQSGGGEQINLHLRGESTKVLGGLSDNVSSLLSQLPEINSAIPALRNGQQEIRIIIDADKAHKLSLTPAVIAQQIAIAMRGQFLRSFRDLDGETQLKLQFSEDYRHSLQHLENLNIPIPSSDTTIDKESWVPLTAIATFHRVAAPQNIQRESRLTTAMITLDIADNTTLDEVKEEISELMSALVFPDGYDWSFGRSFDREEKTGQVMLMNLLLAIMMIYIVMAALFESLLFPTAVISGIIFSVVGVYWFFLITDTTLSFMANIGILVLMGVVVNNGIVLIDHINQLRSQGYERHQALVQAGKDRLRPILMTVATTILGLVPLSMGGAQVGGDGPSYSPMARAIIGGLSFSTIISLLILPLIYTGLDNLRSAWKQFWTAVAFEANR
ncbi:MAG: efflux RND transporter permease subunit [Pseudomonadota bacterium]